MDTKDNTVKEKAADRPIYKIISIAVSIFVALIAFCQLIIALNTHLMSRLVQPIVYTVSYKNAHTQYQIMDGESSRTIDALEPTIKVESGALRTLTVMGFDGDTLYLVESLSVPLSWCQKLITVKAQVGDNPLVVGPVFYDYLFLYLEPIEGAPTLDLVCAEIDLDNNVVLQTYRWQRHNILELEWNPNLSEAKRHMLTAYKKLTEILANPQAAE